LLAGSFSLRGFLTKTKGTGFDMAREMHYSEAANPFPNQVDERCAMSEVLCKDWKELSEAASREQDPQKLLELIEQLNKVLDQRAQDMQKNSPPNQETSPGPIAKTRIRLSA
jgi:hypothetical protein